MTAFGRLARRFAAQLDAVRDLVEPEYVRADWAERNAELERDLLPVPAADFLRHPAIRFQMFVDERVVAHELPYVRARLPWQALLAEDDVGGPPLIRVQGTQLWTSSNTVHQLHHLLRYEEETGRRVADSATVVEWGGGFGSLMRLLTRMHSGQLRGTSARFMRRRGGQPDRDEPPSGKELRCSDPYVDSPIAAPASCAGPVRGWSASLAAPGAMPPACSSASGTGTRRPRTSTT